ncbi:MAG TPA: Glu/Leu/Phe/Val dehydrogenase dimerization domain-containing protein [Thermoanaerobaculia bacterium]|nr:Glu/Leu/Phe/Val dehydrogenase dimerization domain-containing protein [Thermoanaerobaculia bacterium]
MSPLTLEDLHPGTDHERVVFCRDPEAGYRAVIAIHSTAAGPAVGGTRLWSYAREDDALTDALRLSRGMTYKNAMAGLPLGGGKSVILSEAGSDREAMLAAHGRAIERLGGEYVAGEDVGTGPADMAILRRETRHVAGLPGQSGDPSPSTAHGVVRAIRAAALHRWGSDELKGRTIAIQGCGHVGLHLARELAALGARLRVSDLDAERVRQVIETAGAEGVAPEAILDTAADLFAPCALGGVLNAETIPLLQVAVVAGAANNQLREPGDGYRLRERGILYAPDYVVNAGGVISGGGRELLGWSEAETRQRVEGIYDTLLAVLRRAEAEDLPPHAAADRLAEERLSDLRNPRRTRGGGE